GVTMGLAGSATGVNYTLYKGVTAMGGAVAGTGTAISFGLQTVAGTYTVLATSASTGCTAAMTGSASVVVNALPAVYTVTGGGSYCPGGSGVNIGLTGSDVNTSYQLFVGGTATGSTVSGTGTTLNLGLGTTVGTYTVLATSTVTGCSVAM